VDLQHAEILTFVE